MKEVCLVMGAGAGIGGTVGARFAKEGYHALLCRRSDEAGLHRMVTEIQANGGSASGQIVNAVHEDTIENLVLDTEANLGPIDVMVYNLGAQVGNRGLADTSDKVFERGWQMATFGLFRMATCLIPKMVERGRGTFIITSATAAVRGNGGQHAHAAAMGGRRMLAQSLNAEFSKHGIHVVHVLVDGMVNAPDTVGKLIGEERFQQLRDSRGAADGLIEPDKVADLYVYLASQHRSTWSFEVDLRSFSDTPWWNHE